jgi:serine/threonine protein kinase
LANEDPKPESAPAPKADPLLGTVLNGKFRLVSLIGRGGMGKIYKAEQLSLGRMVAIKLLNIVDKTTNITEFRERFYREASLCARLSHPNIVTIHDYGMMEGAEDETLWIAMEFLEGKTLMHRVKSNRYLTPQESVAIVIEIARGVREAHKHGIVHRDLKCSNVMLVADEDGGTRVKILDFGLVKSLTTSDDEDALTVAGGGFLGSPGYMSPEQIQRGMPVDHRTDIYSLGVVLFRCITGRNPFEGDQAQVLIAHVNEAPPTMKQANPNIEVPLELEGLVRRMLEKQPDKRVASAEEVVRALRDIQEMSGWTRPAAGLYDQTGSFSKPQVLLLDPTPTTGGTVPPVAVSLTTPPKKRVKVAALIGGAALLSVVGLVLIGKGSQPELPKVTAPPIAHAKAPDPVAQPPVQPVAQPATQPAQPAQPAAQPAQIDQPVAQPAQPATAPEASKTEPRNPNRTPIRRFFNNKAKAPPVAMTPAVAPPPAPPPKLTPPSAPQAETGFLSLDTTPWANVSDGGRLIGQTPLIKVKMSEGPHTLTLTTEKGTTMTFIVNIKPGQTTSKRLGLE